MTTQHIWTDGGRELLRPEAPKWLTRLHKGDPLLWRDQCLLEHLTNFAERRAVEKRIAYRAGTDRRKKRNKFKNRTCKPWKKEDVETLVSLKLDGFNYRQIADYLGVWKFRVKNKWLSIYKGLPLKE